MTNHITVKDFKMLNLLKKIVEKYYEIDDISTKSREAENVEARVVFCVLAKKITNKSYTKIGLYIKRDHSSISHYHNKNYDSWLSLPKFNIAKLQNIQIIYNNFMEQTSQPSEFYSVPVDLKSSNETKPISEVFR